MIDSVNMKSNIIANVYLKKCTYIIIYIIHSYLNKYIYVTYIYTALFKSLNLFQEHPGILKKGAYDSFTQELQQRHVVPVFVFHREVRMKYRKTSKISHRKNSMIINSYHYHTFLEDAASCIQIFPEN